MDVAAGDQAETSGISMMQSATTPTRRRPSLRAEGRGTAPPLAGVSRPGFVAQRPEAARLPRAGFPLARRTRRSGERLGNRVAGSGFLHALLLVLLSVLFAQHQEGRQREEPQAVEMLYDRPGSAGLTGPTAPESDRGAPPAGKPLPTPQPPVPAPPASPPPVSQTEPLPELPSPDALPKPQPAQQPTPPAPAHARRANPSPFSNPMNLSFSQAPAAPAPRLRPGRRAGSAAPLDLSLGPLVKNGRLLTPYASASRIKGVSDDYGEEIGAWIRRHMYYPEDAAQRGEDGSSHVHVVLDRQGRVRSIRLVTSSGSFSLDDATQGMFRNAQLPPVPPDMQGNSFDVDLTIDYILIRR